MIRHIVWWTLKPEAEGRSAAENAEKTVSGTSVRKTAWKEPRQTAASASTAGSVQGIRLLLYFVIILYYREKK